MRQVLEYLDIKLIAVTHEIIQLPSQIFDVMKEFNAKGTEIPTMRLHT